MAPPYHKKMKDVVKANEKIAKLKKKNEKKNNKVKDLKAKTEAPRAPKTTRKPREYPLRGVDWKVVVESCNNVTKVSMDFDGKPGNDATILKIEEKIKKLMTTQVRNAKIHVNKFMLHEETEKLEMRQIIEGSGDLQNNQYAQDLAKIDVFPDLKDMLDEFGI